MARTPKTAPSPAPTPRGRKPKEVAAPAPVPAATTASEATKAEDATPGAASFPAPAPDSAPARGRPGRKPKARDAAAAPSLLEQALEQQPGADREQPVPPGDDALIAEMAYPVSAGEGSGASAGDAATPPTRNAPAGDAPTPARAAARWDRATDTVEFDWPEIERTASQHGPNQAMAKLLVAARAEGANSRWPL